MYRAYHTCSIHRFLFLLLNDNYGWRVAFRVLALVCFVAVTTAAVLFRVPGGKGTVRRMSVMVSKSMSNLTASEQGKVVVEKVADSEEKENRKRTNKGKLQVLALLKHPKFSRVCVCFLLVSFAFDVPFVHLVRFALDKGMASRKADWLTAGVGAGGLFRIFVMKGADRCG
jgi:cyanate permease